MGTFGYGLDSHSPLLFLLADALANNLFDFRIPDLVVAGRLHPLSEQKPQNSEGGQRQKTHKRKGRGKHTEVNSKCGWIKLMVKSFLAGMGKLWPGVHF